MVQFRLFSNMFALCYLMIVGGLLAVNGDLGDLDGLGERISASVQQSVAPLQGLGRRISDSVEQSVAPLQGLGDRISQSLAGLGDRITAQVETSLLPVRAMELKARMVNGVGGTTVITFDKPYRRQLLVDNYITYVCDGTISPNQPVCSGSVREFQAKAEKDYCFSTYYSSVNDFYCIASSARTELSYSVFNNNHVCTTADNSAALGILQREYERLCGRKYPWMVSYKYYANMNSPDRVEIPNKNPYVACSAFSKGVCTFSGDQGYNGRSSIMINSGNVVING